MTPVADCKISRVASKWVEASGHEKWRSRSAIVIIQRYRSDTIILVISIILYVIHTHEECSLYVDGDVPPSKRRYALDDQRTLRQLLGMTRTRLALRIIIADLTRLLGRGRAPVKGNQPQPQHHETETMAAVAVVMETRKNTDFP